MNTQCPISTISYNSKEFLVNTLNELSIEFWFAVYHYPEKDENKCHWHVYIEPSCRIDTDSLRRALQEITAEDTQPLGCLPFRKSKFGDAALYFLHDKEYLASKFMTREYHYEVHDVVTNSFDFFMEQYSMIERKQYCTNSKLLEFANAGLPFSALVAQGYIPIPLIRQYRDFYDCLVKDNLYRNGKDTHTPIKEIIDDMKNYDDGLSKYVDHYNAEQLLLNDLPPEEFAYKRIKNNKYD